MVQPLLKLEKNWFKGTTISESNWDNIKNDAEDWGASAVNNLNQLGKDFISGNYDYINKSEATIPIPVKDYLDEFESGARSINTKRYGYLSNFKFEISSTNDTNDTITISQNPEGTPFTIAVKSVSSVGVFEIKTVTLPISLVLTDADFGLDGDGDVENVILTVGLLQRFSAEADLSLGVYVLPNLRKASPSIMEETPANVNGSNKIYTNVAVASTSFVYPIGYLVCNYDDANNTFNIQEAHPGVSPEGRYGNWSIQGVSGFSSDPTGEIRYTYFGDVCYLNYYPTSNGTSNGFDFVFLNLPAVHPGTFVFEQITGPITDNGSLQSNLGRVFLGGGNILFFEKDLVNSSGWTNSNQKQSRANFFIRASQSL